MRFNGPVKWYAAAAIASVLVLLAGWFLLVSPQNATAADLSTQADSQAQTNAQTEVKIAALKAQYKNLPTLQRQFAIAQTHLPPTPQLPALLRQLSAAAKSAGVTLDSVSPAAPTPLDTTGTNAVSSTGAAAAGQVNVIPVTITVEGPFANTRLFLADLEAMPRSVLVTGIAMTRASGSTSGATPTTGNSLTTNITARVYSATPTSVSVSTTTSSAAPAAK